jgi:DsbC/DsbD-like thiol-disulfide interchange protein
MMRITPLCIGFLFFSACAYGQPRHVTPELIFAATAVQPGEAVEVAVRFTIEPGWHMYWLNPGDSGMPPNVKWSLPAGVTAEPLRFPAPKRINTGSNMTSFGYEDELVLLTRLRLSPEFSQKTLDVTAKLDWLVCHEKCVMEAMTVKGSIPVGPVAPARADEFNQWRALLPQPDPAIQARIERENGSDRGRLRVPLPAGASAGDCFPPAVDFAVFEAAQFQKGDSGSFIIVSFRILPGKREKLTSDAVVVYTDATGGSRHVSVPVTME